MPSRSPSPSSWVQRSWRRMTPPILPQQTTLQRNGQHLAFKSTSRLSLRASSVLISQPGKFFTRRSELYIRLRRSDQRLVNFLEDEWDCDSVGTSVAIQQTARSFFNDQIRDTDQGPVAFSNSPSPPTVPSRYQHNYSRSGRRTLRSVNSASPQRSQGAVRSPSCSGTPRPNGIEVSAEHMQIPCNPFGREQSRLQQAPQHPVNHTVRRPRQCAVRPVKPKRRGPAVCPESIREYQVSLRQPPTSRCGGLTPIIDGFARQHASSYEQRPRIQAISESVHRCGLEKQLPSLPSRPTSRVYRMQREQLRPEELVSKTEQALAMATAIQGVSPLSFLGDDGYFTSWNSPGHESGRKQSRDFEIDDRVRMSSNEQQTRSIADRSSPVCQKYRVNVDIGDNFSNVVWSHLADEDMGAIGVAL